MLDGVAEGSAGHDGAAGTVGAGGDAEEVAAQEGAVVLVDLAQQPAHGLVHEVVGMEEEEVGEGQGVGILAVAHELHGADDGDALLPEAAAAGKVVEERAVAVQEPVAEELVAAEVHEVPVVDAVGMGEVEVYAAAATVVVTAGVLVYLHQDEEGAEAHLVPRRGKGVLDVGKGAAAPHGLHHATGDGHLDAEEPVAVAVLPGAGLEEPAEGDGLLIVAERKELLLEKRGGHGRE